MQNERRLIAYDAVYQYAFKGIHGGGLEDEDFDAIVKAIDAVPTVDAVEVVHGRNLDADIPSLFECSVCHWCCNDTYYGDTADYNYCPNCGAKMDGGNEDVRVTD